MHFINALCASSSSSSPSARFCSPGSREKHDKEEWSAQTQTTLILTNILVHTSFCGENWHILLLCTWRNGSKPLSNGNSATLNENDDVNNYNEKHIGDETQKIDVIFWIQNLTMNKKILFDVGLSSTVSTQISERFPSSHILNSSRQTNFKLDMWNIYQSSHLWVRYNYVIFMRYNWIWMYIFFSHGFLRY